MGSFRNPIDKFISELGGTVKVAVAAGVSPPVVSSWRVEGRIPDWRLGPVLKLAHEKGITFPGNAPKKSGWDRRRKGIIYFVRPVGMDGPVKIGCTALPATTRRDNVETWCPYPLEVAAEIAGDISLEMRFHAKFLGQRTHGEWFRWTPDLGEMIDAINAGTFSEAELPAPIDLRRLNGNYTTAPRPERERSADSELIDRLGAKTVRSAFGLTSATLWQWRVRGVPPIKRIAFAKLCAENAVPVPDDFFEKFEVKGIAA